jgi:hypothetical protein
VIWLMSFCRDEKKEDDEEGDAVNLIFVCLWWCVRVCGGVERWVGRKEKKLLLSDGQGSRSSRQRAWPEGIENSSAPSVSGQIVKHVRENPSRTR